MKIVINNCFGGFSLSKAVYKELGVDVNEYGLCPLERNDPRLVAAVEKLGKLANGPFAELSIVEIPDDVKWCIKEYDGNEWVAEVHRTWS